MEICKVPTLWLKAILSLCISNWILHLEVWKGTMHLFKWGRGCLTNGPHIGIEDSEAIKYFQNMTADLVCLKS